MEKLPLTPLGVQQLLAALYALPDEQLQQEAQHASNDFGAWVLMHFELSSGQQDYLIKIPANFLSVLAEKVSYYLAGRLSIDYLVPYKKTTSEDPEIDHPGKVFQFSESSTGTYVPNGPVSSGEKLTLSFSYPEE